MEKKSLVESLSGTHKNMKSKYKTREQLIKELEKLQKRVTKLEKSQTECMYAKGILKQSEERYRKLLKIDSGVKAVVSSGYSNDPIMADYKKYGFCGVIAKPYRIKELSEVLKKVITGKNE